MSEIQRAAFVAAGVSNDPVFAAGMEAAVVMKMMSRNEPVILDEDGKDRIALSPINREVYMSFADAFGYNFVLFRGDDGKPDEWRFTKKPTPEIVSHDLITYVGPGVLTFAQEILDKLEK